MSTGAYEYVIKERFPTASDVKRAMREKAALGERSFALTADVKEAHRQVPIAPQDWHLLGCQVTPGSDVYINKVGTFGISSASYYWSRVASSLGRLSQYLVGSSANTWHLLVADDFHLDASGKDYRTALICFFVLCASCRVPLSWNKTAGGDTIAWIGFELLHASSELGISQRRADWFVKWTPRNRELHFRQQEPLRGHVRRGSAGIRKTLLRASLSFPRTSPTRIHQTRSTPTFPLFCHIFLVRSTVVGTFPVLYEWSRWTPRPW